MQGFSWKIVGARQRAGLLFPLDTARFAFVYRFADTNNCSFVINGVLPPAPDTFRYTITVPTGVWMTKLWVRTRTEPVNYILRGTYTIDGNAITIDQKAGGFFLSRTYYIYFADTLMYINDVPRLKSNARYYWPVENEPMLTFKKR